MNITSQQRFDGFSTLMKTVALRMAMPNWCWEPSTWNDLCSGGGFNTIIPELDEICLRLELAAFQSEDYTKKMNTISTQLIRQCKVPLISEK